MVNDDHLSKDKVLSSTYFLFYELSLRKIKKVILETFWNNREIYQERKK